jgi:hypothetical protein
MANGADEELASSSFIMVSNEKKSPGISFR